MTPHLRALFLVKFAEYKTELSKHEIVDYFEDVPLPFLLHSSAIERLRTSNYHKDHAMHIIISPSYDTVYSISNQKHFENFNLNLNNKYATIKNNKIIKLTYEFVEWVIDKTTKIREYEVDLLKKLPSEVIRHIGQQLKTKKDLNNFRALSRYTRAIPVPESNLNKYDMRLHINKFVKKYNAVIENISELESEIDVYFDDIYQPNEAKFLYLAEAVSKNYILTGRHNFPYNDRIKQIIRDSGASAGDILFVGSSSEFRREGFMIKTDKSYISEYAKDVVNDLGPNGLIIFAQENNKENNKDYTNASKLLLKFWKLHVTSEDILDELDIADLNTYYHYNSGS